MGSEIWFVVRYLSYLMHYFKEITIILDAAFGVRDDIDSYFNIFIKIAKKNWNSQENKTSFANLKNASKFLTFTQKWYIQTPTAEHFYQCSLFNKPLTNWPVDSQLFYANRVASAAERKWPGSARPTTGALTLVFYLCLPDLWLF